MSTRWILLFISCSFLLVVVTSQTIQCLQGTERVPGLKDSDSTQARPAGSSDVTPDSAIWPRYQNIGDMQPRGDECFGEAG